MDNLMYSVASEDDIVFIKQLLTMKKDVQSVIV